MSWPSPGWAGYHHKLLGMTRRRDWATASRLLIAACLALPALAVPTTPAPTTTAPSGALELRLLAEAGAYEVVVRGRRWLRSGDTAFFAGGRWLTAQDGSLTLAGNTTTAGSDGLGAFSQHSLTWRGAGGFEAQTNFRSYAGREILTFEQVYVSGATGSSAAGDWDSVSSSFPSWSLMPAGAGAPPLGSVAWRGQFLDQGTAGQSVGMWPPFLGSEGRIFEATEGGAEFSTAGSGGVVTGREAGPIAVRSTPLKNGGDHSFGSRFGPNKKSAGRRPICG